MRRKYCEKKMSLLMQAYQNSELGCDAFAEANSIPISTFYKWRIRYEQSKKHTSKTANFPSFTAIPISASGKQSLPQDLKQKDTSLVPTEKRRMIITTPSGLRLELDV